MTLRYSLLFTLAALLLAPAVAAQAIRINEIRIDQPSTDNDEYFEISGPAGTSLAGYTYLVIGDASSSAALGDGPIEYVFTFPATAVIPADGILLVGGGDDGDGIALGVTADISEDPNFENNDNVTHVLVTGFTGANGDDLDTNDDGTLDVTPWATVVDAIALVANRDVPASGERFYGAALGGTDLGPSASGFVPAHVYRDGASGTWRIDENGFDPATGNDTPGTANPSMTTAAEDGPDNGLGLAVANPLRGTATVTFTLAAPDRASVALYDVLGRRVATLADGVFGATIQTATVHAGSLASGVYVLRLQTEGAAVSRTVTVVR